MYMPRISYRCRSEPQIAVEVTSTIASVGFADRRIRDLIHPHVALALPDHGPHDAASLRVR
jgi:hypothetical protein